MVNLLDRNSKYLYDSVTLEEHPVRDDRPVEQGHLGLDGENWSLEFSKQLKFTG